MKKIIYFVSAAVICLSAICAYMGATSLTSPLAANVEALTESEYSAYGKCKKQINGCIAACPHCNATLVSVPDYLGPAYDLHGTCPNCHQEL